MASLNVLHIMASGARGGGADHLKGLLPELRALGIGCQAAVGDDGPLADELAAAGFAVRRLSLMGSRFALRSAAAQLQAAQSQIQPDLVHFHGTRAAFFGGLIRWWPRRGGTVRPRAVYTAHGLSYRKQMPAAMRSCFLAVEALACRAVDRVVSVCEADLDDLQRRRFVSPGRGKHIPNAVCLDRFGAVSRPQARAILQLDDHAEVVGTVSRLVPQKAVGDLIAAMPSRPGAVLLIIGGGPQRAALEQQAQRRGLDVRFLGVRADIEKLLPALDVFVLSSRWEGEPIALLEAMAAGVPCLATATAGACEVLQHGRVGKLVEVGDVAALGAMLSQLLDDAVERARLAALAGVSVGQRSYAAQAVAVKRIYEDALASA